MSFLKEADHIVYFDLETNGTRPFYKSAIMQMALHAPHLKIQKNLYVQPYDGIIGATEIHQIDAEKLKAESAITSKELVEYLITTFSKTNDIYYFMAYNNFGFDQNVLEHHFALHKMKVPPNWFFVDIMPYIQRYYPDIRKNGGYKLSNVYELLCKEKSKKSSDIQFHTAHDDVHCLQEVTKSVNPSRSKLHPYIRGSYTNRGILLAPISAIAGYAHFFKLEENQIHRIQDLYMEYDKLKSIDFKKYLKEKIGIYSEFYLQKIVEQMEILDDLLK